MTASLMTAASSTWGVKNPDGSVCHVIGVRKAIREALGKGEGDTIRVVITVREEGSEKA